MTHITIPTQGYYTRHEVSNSDLTELKQLLHPTIQYGNKQQAFRFGTLVDALVTEPHKVDYYQLTVGTEQYTEAEFQHACHMMHALRHEARHDTFLAKVLAEASTQHCMAQHNQPFHYAGFHFTLDTRCKWDWYLTTCGFGGDLKTTSATTQQQFNEAIDHFDWDRSRAWYMDIAHSDRDFIYAISKNNCQVFKKFITRGDDTYRRGREKYQELAFQYWCLS